MFWDFLRGLMNTNATSSSSVSSIPTPTLTPSPRFCPADQREADILAKLYPPFRAQVEAMLLKARALGLAVYIFEGLRTWERQAELYAKGRDPKGNVVDKSKVVTCAKPGDSFHNYAMAVDIVFDGDTAKPGIQWTWNEPTGKWKQLGQCGKDCGLEWAGDWVKFPEMPHQQFKTLLTIAQLQETYKRGGLSEVWKLVDSNLLPKSVG
jgi:peptidoglycan L-alanyl-D-glutamate endopeptidase CwlK